MVNCRAMGDARLTIQTRLGPQKGNSETFVIFAAFCANPLSPSGRVLLRKGERICTEDLKGHKGKTGLSVLGKLPIDMVNCRAMGDARLTIQTRLGPQKGNSETFVIFAAFCANPLSP
jgi:hypothetical protein